MNNNNIPLEIIQLRKDVKNKVISISSIENITGIDQSQISRLLNNKNKRKSENYSRLCKFALNNCNLDPNELKTRLIERVEGLSCQQEKLTLLALYGLIGNMD